MVRDTGDGWEMPESYSETQAFQLITGFIHARNYTKANIRKVDLIVLHSMEAPEKPSTAKAVAQWFASDGAPQASCHYCIGAEETWQCVTDMDISWCAPGTNHNGLHFEHEGYASQTLEQWQDDRSRRTLDRSARLAAVKCVEFSIPLQFVDAEDLIDGDRGITTHREVTRACQLANQRGLAKSPFYNKKKPSVPLTTHSDPGFFFPMNDYLAAMRRYVQKP
jgi:hypothetical protein